MWITWRRNCATLRRGTLNAALVAADVSSASFITAASVAASVAASDIAAVTAALTVTARDEGTLRDIMLRDLVRAETRGEGCRVQANGDGRGALSFTSPQNMKIS